MYLLDTNTLIYYFKGKGKVAVRLLQVAPREVAVSTITVYELEVGLAKTSAPTVSMGGQLEPRKQCLGLFPGTSGGGRLYHRAREVGGEALDKIVHIAA